MVRGAAGERIGPRDMACRPATLLWHLAASQASTTDEDEPGRCQPLCATGNSGGASQLAYALADHRAGEVLDTVVLTSGPPHAAMADGCTPGSPDDEAARYESGAAAGIDAAYGYSPGTGPCSRGDDSFDRQWTQDEVGAVAVWPRSLVVLLGAEDGTSAPSHARAWQPGGSDLVAVEVAGMAHHVQQSPEGLAELLRALLTDAADPSAP